MTYVPPGYTPNPSVDMEPGVHTVKLTAFQQHKEPVKFNASVVFIATYTDTATGAEKDDIIKFGAPAKGVDYYSGLRIERLHAIAGIPTPEPGHPIDASALLAAHESVEFAMEIIQNGAYRNIKDIWSVDAPTGTDAAPVPF